MTWQQVAVTALVTGVGLVSTNPARADVVTVWNQQVVTSAGPQIQRTFAMVHIAMFDAVNAVEGGYQPYLQLPAAPVGASAEAAAAAAARGVLLRLFPSQQVTLDALLATSLAGIPDGPDEDAGVAFGDLVAQAVYDARVSDNILVPGPAFTNGTEPGDYRLTTPGPPQPVNTGAPTWKPFAMTSASQFRPSGPPRLGSLQYARDVLLTQHLGGLTSEFRTGEQEQIARWHTEMAPFQFNRIARNEVEGDGRGLLAHARLFALLNIAMADAVTAVFDAKYTYLFWRPSTAIQNADVDRNPFTHQDAGWTPFLTTPPHPEYPAAHGAVQTAGAEVMSQYFGRHHAFETTSPTVPGVTRAYSGFTHFALEGASARIFGGMHFLSALEVGIRQGDQVAAWVLGKYLRPVRRR
jgi:hypothetical protein